MSKIEALIQKLCPDGVPSVRLGEVAEVVRGDRITKKQLIDNGKYPVMSGGMSFFGRYDKFNREAETITVAQYGSAGYISYIKEKFWANDICYSILPKENVINKFLYYVLCAKQEKIYSLTTKAVPDCLPKDKLVDIEFPLPPLAVQREVVRILDKFSALEAELEAELEARKKQYEHYRDHLLNFSNFPNVKWLKLGEVAFYVKDRVNAAELDENTYIGVENLLKDKLGRTDSTVIPQGSVIQFKPKDILIGNIRPYLRKIWEADCCGGTNGDVLCIRVKNESELAPDYLYQVLASERFFIYDMQNSKGAKMPRGDKSAVMSFEIPIPPLSEQARIVGILDRFEALTTSLQEGLPAEIAARRQQYEHYRDRLLEFKIKN